MMTDENQSVVRLPAGTSEMDSTKFGQKRRRRPLTVIDQNNHPCHPHLVNKRPHHDNTQSCMIYDDSVAYEKKIVQKSDVAVEEVEMEDMFDEEGILDIDGRDAKDPLSVADYVDDMYCYYRKMEACSIDYMSQQPDINDKMRAILIDWLIEVHHKFELRDETLFLTVSIIDRFLARHNVARNKLQLVGLIAMLLACKYEEVSVPIVDDLIFISDKAYTRHHLLQMERLILNTLEFNMSLPTPYVFLTRFLKAAESDRKLQLLSFYLTELSLVEYEIIKFPPSLLAAAAVYTAQSTLYGFKQWNRTCEFYTNYSEHQLLECSKLIVSFHQKAATGKLNGVYSKYSTSKFGFAAECEPALFIMHHHTQVYT